jgi:Icc-related predicted phosphoesterase
MGRYEALERHIRVDHPDVLLFGGDLFPHRMAGVHHRERVISNFLDEYLAPMVRSLKEELGPAFPVIGLILGNDDGRAVEAEMIRLEQEGLWRYLHRGSLLAGPWSFYGYAFVPPTPFLLKDWERYDVSRHVDPGCISPEDGCFTVSVDPRELRYTTISDDIALVFKDMDPEHSICMFHSPPYDTVLDRAALDGKFVDHAPLDVHVGSIAIRRFIERRMPVMTLHGHIHESAGLTGQWKQYIGPTLACSAAHNGPELAIIRFSPDHPEAVVRELV